MSKTTWVWVLGVVVVVVLGLMWSQGLIKIGGTDQGAAAVNSGSNSGGASDTNNTVLANENAFIAKEIARSGVELAKLSGSSAQAPVITAANRLQNIFALMTKLSAKLSARTSYATGSTATSFNAILGSINSNISNGASIATSATNNALAIKEGADAATVASTLSASETQARSALAFAKEAEKGIQTLLKTLK